MLCWTGKKGETVGEKFCTVSQAPTLKQKAAYWKVERLFPFFECLGSLKRIINSSHPFTQSYLNVSYANLKAYVTVSQFSNRGKRKKKKGGKFIQLFIHNCSLTDSSCTGAGKASWSHAHSPACSSSALLGEATCATSVTWVTRIQPWNRQHWQLCWSIYFCVLIQINVFLF